MAMNEAGFKREFRKALELTYAGTKVAMWTNNDMFRVGLPDFSAVYDGTFYAIEAKYVKAPPARETSKVLSHELTEGQRSFLSKVDMAGGIGVVLLGFEDVAVAAPYALWKDQLLCSGNITLASVRLLKDKELSFPKLKGKWNVDTFFLRVKEAVRGREQASEILL